MSRSKDLADSAEVINFLDNITTDINSGLTSKLSISTNLSDLADADVALVNLGLTATATELNYTDGVTSAIQTQLDTKAPLASPTFTGTVTADGLVIDTDTLYVDSVNNRVGIGTSSPSKNLHVYNATTDRPAVIESGDANSLLEFKDNSTTNPPAIGATSNNLIIQTGTTNAERMRIDSSGNVGIGTSAPASNSRLHVRDDTSSLDNYTIHIQTYQPAIVFQDISGASADFAIQVDSSAMMFRHGDAATGTQLAFEAMRIDSSGNLLVGKTVPSNDNVGQQFAGAGGAGMTRDGGIVCTFNRKTSDGTLLNFEKNGTTVGSIGVGNNNRLTIGTGDTGLMFDGVNNAVFPWDISTNAVPSSDRMDLGYNLTGLRFKDLHLSGGVYLGGTTSANKLDDYEEGTWSPVFWDGTNDETSSSVQSATYTKIGRVIYIEMCVLNVNTTGMTAGSPVYIKGLPFTPSAGGVNDKNVIGAVQCDNVTTAAGSVFLRTIQSQTYARLVEQTTTGEAGLIISDLTSGNADFRINGFYIV